MKIENLITEVSKLIVRYLWVIPISIHNTEDMVRIDIGDKTSMSKFYIIRNDVSDLTVVYNQILNCINKHGY